MNVKHWLHNDIDICRKTGLLHHNIYFCENRIGHNGKDRFVRQLNITHFIDDRIEIIRAIYDSSGFKDMIDSNSAKLIHFVSSQNKYGKDHHAQRPENHMHLDRHQYIHTAHNWHDVLFILGIHREGSFDRAASCIIFDVKPSLPSHVRILRHSNAPITINSFFDSTRLKEVVRKVILNLADFTIVRDDQAVNKDAVAVQSLLPSTSLYTLLLYSGPKLSERDGNCNNTASKGRLPLCNSVATPVVKSRIVEYCTSHNSRIGLRSPSTCKV